MNNVELDEILACLPKDKTKFHYARDDYAPLLLSYACAKGSSISQIKQSAFRGLLEKAQIKSQLKSFGDGQIDVEALQYAVATDKQSYLLTAGKWDRSYRHFSQTTCENANLVLRLNFNASHDRAFSRWVGDQEKDYFVFEEHPIMREGERSYYRNTLAWARLDLDFDTGEVLVEEIQNDWLRFTKEFRDNLQRYLRYRPNAKSAEQDKRLMQRLDRYIEQVLAPHFKIWDEAMLTAVITFCVNELGIRRIYYHSFDTGCRLKRISRRLPPKSLYTGLPRRFCFQITEETPRFLQKSSMAKRKLKRIKNPSWYLLTV